MFYFTSCWQDMKSWC